MQEADNEMPLPFHFLAGATALGNMIGLRAWATLNKGVRIYPNVNALLLSPAGQARRGEGTKLPMRIAKAAGVNVLAGKTSPEGLLDEIQDRGDVLLYSEELSMLLTKQDFQRPIIPILTKLLLHGEGSCDMRTRTMGEKRTIERVNLSALFTSAPDWFMTTIPEEAFGGGLMSRFIVCCLERRDVYSINIQAEDDGDLADEHTELARELKGASEVISGYVRGDNDAAAWIKPWYIENETKLIDDERNEPHRNRKPANLLRMALLLAASSFEPVLTRARLENALAILDWMEPTLAKLYGLTTDVTNNMAKGEKRILTKLSSSGGELTHSDLTRSVSSYFKNTREMRMCLEGLLEKGLVAAKYKHTRVSWPPASWAIEGQSG
jgi:hypothetical protein